MTPEQREKNKKDWEEYDRIMGAIGDNVTFGFYTLGVGMGIGGIVLTLTGSIILSFIGALVATCVTCSSMIYHPRTDRDFSRNEPNSTKPKNQHSRECYK